MSMTLIERDRVPALAGQAYLSRSAPDADPLSFGSLLQVLRRRWRLLLAVMALAVGGSLAAAMLLPVEYSAKARLMIDPRPHASILRNDSKSPGAPDATLVDTEVELMTSPMITRAVVQRLGLARDPEFVSGKGAAGGIDAVAESLLDHVGVAREGLTYVVSIRARSHDPNKAAAIANALADEYLRQSKTQRSRLAAEQARTLTAELGPLGQQVLSADQMVANFRAAHGIVGGGTGANGGTVNDQQISTIAAELGRASADAAAARAAASAARAQVRTAGADSVSQVLNSSSLTELRNQRAQVLREQAQISTIYGSEHPALARINKQLARLDSEISAASNRIVSGLESDARAAESRAGTLRGALAALEARQMQDAKAEVVANGLQRDADAKRSTLNDLSRNAQEQAQAARIGDVRAWFVAPAGPPLEPSFPKKSIFLILGLVLGSGLGAGAVVAAEIAERGFRTAEDLEAEVGVPLLAAVPELPKAARRGRRRHASTPTPWDYVVEKPVSSFAESIRNVRATLLDDSDEASCKAVCVTSALVGEGKTTTAVALARVMAMSGDRVLLIDCDLRRSGLARLRREAAQRSAYAASSSADLVQVLDGEVEPHKAIMDDVVPGLTFLGLDGPFLTSRDLFSAPAARGLIDRLKTEYDFIILDAPPLLAVTDAWSISSICDATLLVVRQAKTPRAAVRAAIDRLRLRGGRLHGVVLTRTVRSVGGVGYYDNLHSAYYQN
jgi:capsular exopolysaccharide synthesis family protein